MTIKIWHNPGCSKSRATLALLIENGVEPQVIDYKKSPPTVTELKQVLRALGIKPIELVRKSETAFSENGLSDSSPDAALIKAMVANPILIERPIVINGTKAAIGRPPEDVLKIL